MERIKPIAIYLPQFHPIPENDLWWEKGFTEWTNVTKAKPLFRGHYQPHLPTDLGFYDLRLTEARMAQEALAKEHGIFGFCYYHYWFNGKRLLYEPLDRKLKNQEEDLPFMLCWANENWTRSWDGGDNHILMDQNYTIEDVENHIDHLIPIFQDKRYIKIGDRPIFAIYRSDIIPNLENYLAHFRSYAKKKGVDIYLVRFESFSKSGNELVAGFDAAVEFQPFSDALTKFRRSVIQPRYNTNLPLRLLLLLLKVFKRTDLVSKMQSKIFNRLDYKEYVDFIVSNYTCNQTYLRFPGIMPSWDNTARRGKGATLIFKNSSPEDFERWFSFLANKTNVQIELPKFIFINAWNEWAEGNHLEPCRKFKRSYLEAVKKVIHKQADEY